MKPTLSLAIPAQNVLSDIIVEQGMFQTGAWLNCLSNMAQRIVIITDHQVRGFFAGHLFNQLKTKGFDAYIFSIPAGEKSKTRQSKEHLEDKMLEAGLGRDTVLLAVGGGVVTDLAGFLAATYCRGLTFISIPTTLLGQVDASLGGKVGVNTPYGKNLIGALHYPRWIWMDPDVLSTLPQREVLNGMAEIIKYALIASESLFEQLQNKTPWEKLIQQSCLIKQQVVEKDPQEKGLRRVLNFGHTVGHALETLTNYQLSHGEAVAIGMLAEARLSWRLGYLPREEFLRIAELLQEYGFLLQIPPTISEKEFMQVIKRDKKAALGLPRFVLLNKIGQPMSFDGAYCCPIEDHILKEIFLCLHSKSSLVN